MLRKDMNTLDQAVLAAAPIFKGGYRMTDQRISEFFGNGFVVLARGDVRVRVLCERGQWFVEVGSSVAPEEWFDARLVLSEIGVSAPDGTSVSALNELCARLSEHAAKWEALFLSTTFHTARKALRARQLASARERFGITIEDMS